jgi:triacylglycerol lipase
MRSANYVGRVGVLAFAIGVGSGLAACPWASADPSDSGSPSTSAVSDNDANEPGTGGPSSHDSKSTHIRIAQRPLNLRHSSAGTVTTKRQESSRVNRPISGSPTGESAGDSLTAEVVGNSAASQGFADHRRGPRSSAAQKGGSGSDTTAAPSGSSPATTSRKGNRLDTDSDERGELRREAPSSPSVGSPAAAPPAVFARSFSRGIDTRQPQQDYPRVAPSPAATTTFVISTLTNPLSPLANGTPRTPIDLPAMWTLAAFSRGEFDLSTNRLRAVSPLVGHMDRTLGTGTVSTDLTATAALDAVVAPPVFTGQPSVLSQALSAAFGLVATLSDKLGVDLTTPLVQAISSDSPPRLTTIGLSVQRTEFEGMAVWAIQSPTSTSDEVVVAIHGGALVSQPPVFNWLFYADMARDTGATVLVPIYPLVPEGGTAGTVVPAMADLISAQIDAYGAENVSVFGDSAGGNIALAAVQEMVRRGDLVPSRMVLSSPGVDSTLSNPAIQFVDDPVLSSAVLATLRGNTELWADGLDLTDPLLSPLYGSLVGLPPTVIYTGSRDVVMPDLLLLREKALATPGSDFTFILREGEFHDWLVIPLLPETQALLPDVYQQLGILPAQV